MIYTYKNFFFSFFSKHKILFLSFLIFFSFSLILRVFAAAPPGGYLSSDHELNPDCTFDEVDCFVNSGGSPGGNDTYVQYNDGGVFGGDSNFIWDKNTKLFQVGDLDGISNNTSFSLDDTNQNIQALVVIDEISPEYTTFSIDSVGANMAYADGANVWGISAESIGVLRFIANGLWWIWPNAEGNLGDVLTTDGSGVMTWTDVRNRTAPTVTVAAADSKDATYADYMADGVADEVQIQAAIDEVASFGGGTVMLLEGTFVLSDSIVFDSDDDNITLRGSGKDQTIIEGALAAETPYIDLDSTGTTLSYVTISHMTIDGSDHAEDLVLDGGLINNSDTGNLENASFHDLRILIPANRNNGIGLWSDTGTNKYIRIYNNEIYQQFARTYGIAIRKYTEHLWIEDNFISSESPSLDAYNAIAVYGGSQYFHINNNSVVVSGTAHAPIAVSTSSYGEIVGNVIEAPPNNDEGGIEVEWKDGHDSAVNSGTAHHVLVANNVVYGGEWCIYTRREDLLGDAPHDIVITGNNVSGCTVGINLLDGNDITVYGNHYDNNGTDFTYDTDVTFSNTELETGLDVFTESASGYAGTFLNDGNDANRYGLEVQAGADDASGTTYYLNALDGDGDQIGYIANTSGTFALTDVSDIRTKTNIENTLMSGIGIIESLRVVDFNRIQNPEGPKITGFIAQEVQEVFPQMVSESTTGLLGISKDSLIPVAVKAIQELDLKITKIETMSNQSFKDYLISWFGDFENGIQSFFADVMHSNKVETKELCIEEICITKDQLQQLLQDSGQDFSHNGNEQDNGNEEEVIEEIIPEENVEEEIVVEEISEEETIEEPVLEEEVFEEEPIVEEEIQSEEPPII